MTFHEDKQTRRNQLNSLLKCSILRKLMFLIDRNSHYYMYLVGAQWLSGRVLDSRPKGSGFEPHRRHCVVVLEQDTFILA